ncbi:aminotransferase class V-fold PLP-dependent enzyme [Oharaeibacter diazotrophicus]|uniref:Serine--glyoxylate aminotransferase n=1 Tax=Oharaeibacter diazotrophicus TaxID=1920512 RepID=A0A4R6RLG0_9HYPH|nr:aminotransferase class V-fold PLP-dependent enzyme [Oharaeibacter diazotrophicus]TDP86945.1 serine-glyoxylate aminotransferase [Oharaeibacter diazotrophicus]BBE71112.1 serine-glyoxylate aminotransferase [Pleomorphomonas sp. SM30]GLS77865.1 serine--glyoxylate aminotransferase [Oharaeibacter diazotrophicus]
MRYHTGLFIPGPTNVPDQVRRAMNLPQEDMRAPDFPKFTLPLFADLKKVFKTETGQPFIYPSSGTGGWEAVLTNTLNPGDKVLISTFGQFSLLWADMCQRLGFETQVVDVEWGEGVPVEKFHDILAADKEHRIKAVLGTQNETATGVTSDVAGMRKALDAANHPALLYIDGVSSVASIDFRMDEWGVDAIVSGSQKGFMLPTGLAIICVSQKALEAHKTSRFPRCFFSFEDMTRTNKDGYFPYTPATVLLRGLRASLDLLFEEGLENVFTRHHHIAEGVRKAVDAWGMKLCAKEAKWHSDTVSAIIVPSNVDSAQVVRQAYNRYGVSFGVGLNKVAGKVFRIGHLGATNELMLLGAVAAAEMALVDCGADIEFGSGVAAAQAYYGSRRNVTAQAA